MANKPRIQGQTDKGKRINLPESVNYDKKPPIFSLERIQSGKYCFTALDKDHKAQFAEALFKRRLLTWAQIKSIDRQGLGFEKIAKNAIRAAMPSCITAEVEHFLAFRFNGKKPMVGYRVNEVF